MPQTMKTDPAHRFPPPSGQGAQRLVWLDSLRLTAGISMVGLHASADMHGLPFAEATAEERFWPMMLRALFYCARTELFIMISIFLLMMSLEKRPRNYQRTMVEQGRRLLIPFLFWTVFYSLFSLIKAWHLGYLATALDQLSTPAEWLERMVLGSAKYHMHFIPTLFGILLFYPVFRCAVKRPWLLSAAIVGLTFKWTMERWAYPAFWGTAELPYIIRAIKIVGYLGYGLAAAALAGMWMRHAQQFIATVQRPVFTILLLSAMALISVKIHTMLGVIATGQWVFDDRAGYWADFLMPIVLLALCMTLASRKWPQCLSRWAPYSLGVYLCHPIFMDLAEMLLAPEMTPLAQVIAKLTITIPLTLGLVRFLDKNRALGWTVGLGPLPSLAIPKHALRQG